VSRLTCVSEEGPEKPDFRLRMKCHKLPRQYPAEAPEIIAQLREYALRNKQIGVAGERAREYRTDVLLCDH
jgi:hypothetical protein